MIGGRVTCLFGCLLLVVYVKAFPRTVYRVTVKTSEDLDAGADPNDKVFIKLFGENHITDFKELKGDQNAFERNTLTTFEINAQNVGKIKSFAIKKTAKGKADKWNLNKVSVEDVQGDIYEAMCKCWLSQEKGLERTLVPTNVIHKKSMLNDPVPTESSTGSPVPGSSGPTTKVTTGATTAKKTTVAGSTTAKKTTVAGSTSKPSSGSTDVTFVPTQAAEPTEKPSKAVDPASDAVLHYINTLRLLHGTGPVINEQNMSMLAEKVAQKLSSASNGSDVEHEYGINICAFADSGKTVEEEAAKCVSRWYETVKNYDWSSSVVTPQNAQFAQLVWKETTHVGIASNVQKGKESHIVVLFDPRYQTAYQARENISPVKDVTDGSSQECFPPFSSYGRSCFAFLDAPVKWDAAIAECAQHGASLASLDNQDVNTYLSGLLSGKKVNGSTAEAWIGFSDRLQESRYQWTDGSAATYHHFLPTEPTGNGENCVAIMSSSNASGWVDKKCSDALPVICEMPIQAPITYKITLLIEHEDQPAPIQPVYNNGGYPGGYSAGYPGVYNGGFSAYGKKKSGIPKNQNPLIHKHKSHGHKRSFVPGLVDYVALIKKTMSDLEGTKLNFVGDSSMIGSDSGYYVSVYLKQPFPVNPSPAQALQKYLEQNQNHLAANSTANATLACVSIVCGGTGCVSQCSTTCSSQCSSSCCSGTVVINPQPAPAPQPLPYYSQQQQPQYASQYPSPYPYPYPSAYPSPYGADPYNQQQTEGCVRSCSKKSTKKFCPAYCPKSCCRNKY